LLIPIRASCPTFIERNLCRQNSHRALVCLISREIDGMPQHAASPEKVLQPKDERRVRPLKRYQMWSNDERPTSCWRNVSSPISRDGRSPCHNRQAYARARMGAVLRMLNANGTRPPRSNGVVSRRPNITADSMHMVQELRGDHPLYSLRLGPRHLPWHS
jgi:hypothetical protein